MIFFFYLVKIDSLLFDEETTNQRTPSTTLSLQSIFASNEHENQEGILLNWYDKNIGVYNAIELLQKINDYVLICSHREACIEFLNQITTDKLFLILSGISAEDILDEIHDYQQNEPMNNNIIKEQKHRIQKPKLNYTLLIIK
jgi:hypothetical protein